MRQRGALAAVVLVALAPAALAAPTITVRGRARVRVEGLLRTEGGARVTGRLTDAGTTQGIDGRAVTIEVDGQTITTLTSRSGAFEEDVTLAPGAYQVTARFAGDELYAADETSGRYDVGKGTLLVSLRLRGDVDVGDAALEGTVRAVGDAGAQAVPITLFLEDVTWRGARREVAHVGTEDEPVPFRVPRAELGRPGEKRLVAAFAGDESFNPAEADAAFRVSSETRLVDLGWPGGLVKFEDKIRVTGRLVEDGDRGPGGTGVERAPVELLSGSRRVAAVLTDHTGRFSLRVKASEFAPGPVTLLVEHTSTVPWRRGVRSAPLSVTVAEPKPVPVTYTAFAFAATAAAFIAFVLYRTRPWTLLGARKKDAPPAAAGPSSPAAAAPTAGLKPARAGIMSTLRRPADHGFSGVVRDAVRGHAIAGARLVLENPVRDQEARARGATCDEAGAFAIEELAAGGWRARAAAPGYVTEHFVVTIPHRGELRGARIDLMPVREKVFAIYRDVAWPLLPKPELWGVWTPREIFDHVRAKRPAGALGALTTFVEEAYFSQRTPGEEILAPARASADAARQELGR